MRLFTFKNKFLFLSNITKDIQSLVQLNARRTGVGT